MAGDDLLVFGIDAEEVAHALCHVAVAGAVETIAADAILLIQFVWYGIHVSVVGHGLVEGGVEHAHLRQTGHQLANGLDSLEVRWVVEWSEVAAFLKHF